MSIKVILADDHVLLREGIKQLLEYDGSIMVVAEANNGIECIEKVKKEKADILLLDINMPEMNGIQVLEELKQKKSKIKILILTVHNEVEYLIKAVDIGINGYVLKDSGSKELKEAISVIMSGEDFIEPSLIPALNSRLINRDLDSQKIDSLTRRELQILFQIASGKFNRDIGNNLNISERTVKNHVSSIFKKLDVTDRTQAAVFAIRNNIVKIY